VGSGDPWPARGDEIKRREKSLCDTRLRAKDRTARAGDDTETDGRETRRAEELSGK
jgi:hypothetical protein